MHSHRGSLPPPLLLTFGCCHSYFVARKGGLVLSQACYALHDGGGPTSESPWRVWDFIVPTRAFAHLVLIV